MKRKSANVRKISSQQQRQMSWSMASLNSPATDNLNDLIPTPDTSIPKAKKSRMESNGQWDDAAQQFPIQLSLDITKVQPTQTYTIGQFTVRISLDKWDNLELQHAKSITLSFPEDQVDGIATVQINETGERTLQCFVQLPVDVLHAIHILVSKNQHKQTNAALIVVDNMQTDNQVLILTLSLLLDSPAFATVLWPSQLVANTGASHLIRNLPIVIRYFLGHQINSDDFQNNGELSYD